MNGKAILKVVNEIENGEYYSVWNLLPDVASGEEWVGEIKDACSSLRDYINEEEDYDLDEMRDWSAEYADNACASSYKYIHDQVHALSLWASNDIESEIEDFGALATTDIKKLESLYYYVAMRMVFDAVADQAHQNAEEQEEVNA